MRGMPSVAVTRTGIGELVPGPGLHFKKHKAYEISSKNIIHVRKYLIQSVKVVGALASCHLLKYRSLGGKISRGTETRTKAEVAQKRQFPLCGMSRRRCGWFFWGWRGRYDGISFVEGITNSNVRLWRSTSCGIKFSVNWSPA